MKITRNTSINFQLFLTAVLFALAYYFIFAFMRDSQYDSQSFISGVKLLYGMEGGEDLQARLSKPLSLILPGALSLCFELDIEIGFLIQNILFFVCTIYLVYHTYSSLHQKISIGFYSVLTYFTLPPIAIFSLFTLTDITGWFFIFLALYICAHKKEKQTHFYFYLILGSIIGIGSLFKESAYAGAVYILFFVFFQKHSGLKKLIMIMLFLMPLVASFLIGMYISDKYSAEGLISRQFSLFKNHGFDSGYSWKNISQVYRIFDLFWIPILMGIWDSFRRGFNQLDKTMFFSALLILLLLPLAHANSIHDRILMMCAPFFLYFMPFGLFGNERIDIGLILFYGILNIFGAYLIYKYQVQNLLWISLLLGLFSYIYLKTFLLKTSRYTNGNNHFKGRDHLS